MVKKKKKKKSQLILGGEKFSYKAPNFYVTVYFKILRFTSSWYNLEMGKKIPVKIHGKNGARCH